MPEQITEAAETQTTEPTAQTEQTTAQDSSPASEETSAESSSSWYDSLPDDMKSDATMASFKGKDFSEVAKALVNTKKMVGAKGVIVPGKDAKPEDIAAYRKAIGVPDEPGAYRVPSGPDSGMPENFKPNEEFTKKILESAHKHGIPERAMAGLYRDFAHMTAESIEAKNQETAQSREANVAKLKQELGGAFDEATKAVPLFLAKMAEKSGENPDDVRKYLAENPQIGNDPKLFKVLYQAAKATMSDEIIGAGSRANFTLTPDEARMEYANWSAKPENSKALNDNQNPGHAAALAHRDKLFKLMYPG